MPDSITHNYKIPTSWSSEILDIAISQERTEKLHNPEKQELIKDVAYDIHQIVNTHVFKQAIEEQLGPQTKPFMVKIRVKHHDLQIQQNGEWQTIFPNVLTGDIQEQKKEVQIYNASILQKAETIWQKHLNSQKETPRIEDYSDSSSETSSSSLSSVRGFVQMYPKSNQNSILEERDADILRVGNGFSNNRFTTTSNDHIKQFNDFKTNSSAITSTTSSESTSISSIDNEKILRSQLQQQEEEIEQLREKIENLQQEKQELEKQQTLPSRENSLLSEDGYMTSSSQGREEQLEQQQNHIQSLEKEIQNLQQQLEQSEEIKEQLQVSFGRICDDDAQKIKELEVYIEKLFQYIDEIESENNDIFQLFEKHKDAIQEILNRYGYTDRNYDLVSESSEPRLFEEERTTPEPVVVSAYQETQKSSITKRFLSMLLELTGALAGFRRSDIEDIRLSSSHSEKSSTTQEQLSDIDPHQRHSLIDALYRFIEENFQLDYEEEDRLSSVPSEHQERSTQFDSETRSVSSLSKHSQEIRSAAASIASMRSRAENMLFEIQNSRRRLEREDTQEQHEGYFQSTLNRVKNLLETIRDIANAAGEFTEKEFILPYGAASVEETVSEEDSEDAAATGNSNNSPNDSSKDNRSIHSDTSSFHTLNSTNMTS